MSPESAEPGSAQDWLVHARSDLALARMKKTRTVLYEHLCSGHKGRAAQECFSSAAEKHGFAFFPDFVTRVTQDAGGLDDISPSIQL